MLIKLDFRSRDPIYVQIVDQVKHMIAAGSLQPGDQLPTVRQMATDLRVNFNTVARAYRLLDDEGVISTQQGRGTYILEQPIPNEQRKLRRQRLTDLIEAFLAEAQRLGYDLDEVEQGVVDGTQARRAAAAAEAK